MTSKGKIGKPHCATQALLKVKHPLYNSLINRDLVWDSHASQTPNRSPNSA